jgi:CBS domain-containing protein
MAGDPIEEAEAIMAAAQVRRLPVVDADGKIRGVVSLADLAYHVRRGSGKPDGLSLERVAATLVAISQPAPS